MSRSSALINNDWDLEATEASYSLGFHMMTPTVTY